MREEGRSAKDGLHKMGEDVMISAFSVSRLSPASISHKAQSVHGDRVHRAITTPVSMSREISSS